MENPPEEPSWFAIGPEGLQRSTGVIKVPDSVKNKLEIMEAILAQNLDDLLCVQNLENRNCKITFESETSLERLCEDGLRLGGVIVPVSRSSEWNLSF